MIVFVNAKVATFFYSQKFFTFVPQMCEGLLRCCCLISVC